MSKKDRQLDFAQFSSRMEGSEKRDFWRNLDELSGEESFSQLLHSEFPYMEDASRVEEAAVDRRQFLKFMGASIAFAGLAACRRPAEAIIPYVNKPEEIIPGKPLFFATAMTLGGGAIGLLVESHEGRPTKIEGNPEHPGSLGATDAFAQASVLSLYDPDRSQTVRELGEVATWNSFVSALQSRVTAARGKQGSGLRILTEAVVSPTLGYQLQTLLATMPGAKWHQWEPVNGDQVKEGSRIATGAIANPIYQFSKADVVVSIDSEVFSAGPGHIRYAREFATRRRVRSDKKNSTRLYAIDAFPTNTGAVADHKLRVRGSDIAEVMKALAAAVGVSGVSGTTPHAEWVTKVGRDLQAHRGRSLIVVGDEQPAALHALAHAMNSVLGNIGTTVQFTDPVEVNPTLNGASLLELVTDMKAGAVESLIILGGNPLFTAPADFGFAEALEKVAFRAHLSSHYDETSANCHWHIPEAHFLEAWSDARAFDGTVSIVQPLIAPLFNGKSAHELLTAVTGETKSAYEIIRNHWALNGGAADFGKFWEKSVHDGVIANTAYQPRAAAVNVGAAAAAAGQMLPVRTGGYELMLRPDPTIHDGRFANNGWLQELPKPVTKITWDNVAHVSPATAKKLGITDEDLIEISYRGRAVRLAAYRTPGHADDSITAHFGYGRKRVGKVGDGVGVNLYPLRMSDGMSLISSVEVKVVGGKYPVAATQHHFNMDTGTEPEGGRGLVRRGTLAGFIANPEFARLEADYDRSMNILHGWDYKSYAWGMSIDTSACLGCGGCVVACVAENNIPVIGKKEVRRGREMHWLRIDRYYEGAPDNPLTYHQPMMCQHCENAPCEPVCPVEATTHSPEGINEMTYNRCIGTRYCSNNCPYKVRRFNFFQYTDWKTPTFKLQRNPDVTTRSRGVMEKCTFCVQRVNEARIVAERENRKIRDGEVVTACQAACPTEAIIFGDINNPESRVARLKAEPHNYKVLGDINTNPRATYLATIRNPNPEVEAVRG